MNSTDEITNKRKCAINDFDKLLSSGEVGYYNSCQVTQIFLLEKQSKKVFNYLTVAVFEEAEYTKEAGFLTKKPLSINAKYQLCILQTRLTVKDAKSLFEEIQKGNFSLNSEKCEIGKQLVLLPKQLISASWDFNQKLPVGNILKPNYWGDCYIIEFFCEDKPLTSELSEVEIDKINKCISDTEQMTINLVPVFERTENIIFQFPVTLISYATSLTQSDTLEVSVYTHPELKSPIDLLITARTSLDNSATGYANRVISSSQCTVNLLLGDSNRLELSIAKANSDILLHQSLSNYIRSFGGLMLLGTQHSEPRTIITRSGSVHRIPVTMPVPISVNIRKDDFFTQIRHREIENELLQNSGECKVFDTKNGQEEAFQFVRGLFNRHMSGIKEVCLWDPYLRAPDIIDTLYFQSTGLPLKCITSLIKARDIDENGTLGGSTQATPTYSQFKDEEVAYFRSHSNNLGVTLEYRCQHDIYGTAFHDRFIVFVPSDTNELPTVYSLGASVNSLGKAHHLIQKVTDARLILRNFNIMWDKLDPNHCRIVLFPEDLR